MKATPASVKDALVILALIDELGLTIEDVVLRLQRGPDVTPQPGTKKKASRAKQAPSLKASVKTLGLPDDIVAALLEVPFMTVEPLLNAGATLKNILEVSQLNTLRNALGTAGFGVNW